MARCKSPEQVTRTFFTFISFFYFFIIFSLVMSRSLYEAKSVPSGLDSVPTTLPMYILQIVLRDCINQAIIANSHKKGLYRSPPNHRTSSWGLIPTRLPSKGPLSASSKPPTLFSAYPSKSRRGDSPHPFSRSTDFSSLLSPKLGRRGSRHKVNWGIGDQSKLPDSYTELGGNDGDWVKR